MAMQTTIKVVENCLVSPPPNSVADTVLPLTYFDVPWIGVYPLDRLYFYELQCPITCFIETHLPNLKHSLSLALQVFFPLAGNLTRSPDTGEHEICYVEGDSVGLTVAETDADFHWVVADQAKTVTSFHPLVPKLSTSDLQRAPLLALQVTVFPNSGICIGKASNHVVADGKSLSHFMNSWATICRSGGDVSTITSLPSYDRTLLTRLDWVKRKIMLAMEEFKLKDMIDELESAKNSQETELVMATFTLDQTKIEGLRKWVLARANPGEKPLHCSSFVITTAYVWVCRVKAKANSGDKLTHFLYSAERRTRQDPPLPATYFGNVFAVRYVETRESRLTQEDGLVVAVEVIGRDIQALQESGLKGAVNGLSKFESIVSKGEIAISTAGSPRHGLYEADFGWGRPRKTEVTSIEKNDAISLAESREEKGGIEVGIVLPRHEMDSFVSFFYDGLKVLD